MVDHRVNDPFASITKLCHVSASQEERLRHCSFALESDGCSGHDDGDSSDPTQSMEVDVASTGIVMVSPPESSEEKDDSNPHDVFQTPTEGSLLASSEEQQQPMAVDGPRHSDAEALAGCTDGSEAVDLGKDSDLGFSEVELAQRVYDEDSVCESEKLGLLRRESSLKESLAESPSKKLKILDPNLASEAPEPCTGALSDSDPEIHQNTEIIEDSEVEANDEEIKVCGESSAKRKLAFPYGDTEIVQSESEEDWEETEEGEVNHEKANASKIYRVLPVSMHVPAENRAERVDNNGGLNGKEVTILDVLKFLKDGCDEEDDSLKSVSIFDMCKQQGMTFPQPCWWPEEGFEVVDDKDK